MSPRYAGTVPEAVVSTWKYFGNLERSLSSGDADAQDSCVCVGGGGGGGGDRVLSYTVHSEQMLLRIEAQLYTHRECITFRPRKPSSLSSVHSCTSMLNNICSESMSAAKMSLYSIVTLYMYYG